MAKYSPAFQFYPADWLSSESVMLMTPAEEGAFIRLLALAWQDENCTLPDDDKRLAVLSRLGKGWLKGGSSTKIRKKFIPHPTLIGRLYNERLMDERARQNIWRQKSQEGGIKSAKMRDEKSKMLLNTQISSKGGSTVVEGCLPNGSNQTSTLLSPPLPPPLFPSQENNISPSAPAADAAVCEIPRTPHPKSEYSPEFEAFWSGYPAEGRKAKAGAWKAWKKLKPDRELQLRMVAALEEQSMARFAQSNRDPKAFIPCWKHCATWINGGCWEDEISKNANKSASADIPEFSEPVAESRGPRPWSVQNDHPIWVTLLSYVDGEAFSFLDDYSFGVSGEVVYILAPSKFALDLHFRLNDKLDQLREIIGNINNLVTVKLDWMD